MKKTGLDLYGNKPAHPSKRESTQVVHDCTPSRVERGRGVHRYGLIEAHFVTVLDMQ